MDTQLLLQQMFDEKGLTAAERERVMSMIGESLEERLLLATLEYLPKDDRPAFNDLLEKSPLNPAEVYSFLRSRIAAYDALMEREARAVVRQYIYAISL